MEEDKTYPDDAEHTRRRFKMSRTLFNRTQADVVKYNNYFVSKKYDAYFTQEHDAARKDVEKKTFDVLQSHFAIAAGPAIDYTVEREEKWNRTLTQKQLDIPNSENDSALLYRHLSEHLWDIYMETE
ncbi:hypothetical protein BD770DRAFT_448430 [Pilaira anomala]|nr:hypothetical protein BD770DRAFT_448430 [Pilaira anomala]